MKPNKTVKVIKVPLSKIVSRDNSRVKSDYNIDELMISLKQDGMLQPIGVVKTLNKYDIVWGNRRYLAVKKLGWKTIDAVVVTSRSNTDRMVLNLAENVQRENITLLEEGLIYKQLKKNGLSNKEIVARLGVTRRRVDSALQSLSVIPVKWVEKSRYVAPGAKAKKGQVSSELTKRVATFTKSSRLSPVAVDRLMFAASKGTVTTNNLNVVASSVAQGSTMTNAIRKAQRHVTRSFSVTFRKNKLVGVKLGRTGLSGSVARELKKSPLFKGVVV